MAERVRYRTKQQELIRECLKKHSGRFLTAEQCMDCLKVIKIPAVDGASAQFRYVGELKPGSLGRLVCLVCGKIIPLECRQLDGFSEHIRAEHDFELDGRHMILYGYCSGCRKDRAACSAEGML